MATVGVIGAGLVGRAWAMVFARAGWGVALYDNLSDVRAQAPALIARSLAEMAAHGLVDDPASIAKRIRVVTAVADAVAGASFVQENVPETIEAKIAIFAELDRLATPDAILASSTSAIIASAFTEKLKVTIKTVQSLVLGRRLGTQGSGGRGPAACATLC